MKKARIYGYCRISTMKQKIARQVDNIKKEYPDAVIIEEKYTGTTTSRPELVKLLKNIKTGDTLVFDEVSRMSRDAAEGYALYRELYEKGVNLVFLKERHIDTEVFKSTAQAPLTGTKDLDETLIKGVNEYLMRLAEKQIKIAFEQAQAEVDFLHQRTSEGVRKAQAAGKQVGRASGTKIETKKARECKARIKELSRDFGGSNTDAEIMLILQVSRNSFYKYKRELRNG